MIYKTYLMSRAGCQILARCSEDERWLEAGK